MDDAGVGEWVLSSPCLQRGVELQVGNLPQAGSEFSDSFFASVQLVSIDHERGAICPEAIVWIPKEKTLLRLARQGRTVVGMLSPGGCARSLVIVNLDSPKRIIEAVLPDSPHVRPCISRLSNLWVLTQLVRLRLFASLDQVWL